MATRVLTLEKAVAFSLIANTLGKGMNPTIPYPSMDK